MKEERKYLENHEANYIFNYRIVIFMIIFSALCVYFMEELAPFNLVSGILLSIVFIISCGVYAILEYKKLKIIESKAIYPEEKRILILLKIEAHSYILKLNILASIILVIFIIVTWYCSYNSFYKISLIFFIINLIYTVIDLFKIRLYKNKIILFSPI